MPKLHPNAPEFLGLLPDKFSSALHDEHILRQQSVSDYYRDFVRSTSVSNQIDNFSQISRIAVGRIAGSFGIPAVRAGALSELFESSTQITMGNVEQSIERVMKGLVLKGALLVFDQALEHVASKVPIVGWIVRIGVAIYKGIRALVKMVRDQKKKPPESFAIAYKRAVDEEVTNEILRQIPGYDWTKILQPHVRASDVSSETIAWTDDGAPDGRNFQVTGSPLGFGLTPALSTRFTSVVSLFQYPYRHRGSTHTAAIGDAVTFAQLHPSVQQLGLAVWQMVLKNSANMFRIDGGEIARQWLDYYGTMQDYAQRLDADSQLRYMIMSASSYVAQPLIARDQGKEGRVFDPNPVINFAKWRNFKPGDLPSKYATPEAPYSDLITYAINEMWFRRLKPALSTITVAYVDPSAPGLNAPGIRSYYRDMRRLLLRHKARRDVELDMIPDAEYRSAMRTAQLSASMAFTTGPSISDYALGGLQTILPEPPDEFGAQTDPAIEGGEIIAPGRVSPIAKVAVAAGTLALIARMAKLV